MMRHLLSTISFLFLFIISMNAQYLEDFNIPGLGILSGPCGPTSLSCASTNFSGVSWDIVGDLSGIDSEGLSTKAGGYLHFEDVDEESCWESPLLNISAIPVASINVNFEIPIGATWENSTTVGSTDYMDVRWAVDGGAFSQVANINSCPASGHTVSGSSCSNLVGPLIYNITQPNIVGSFLTIQVCVDTNSSGDDGYLHSVGVPQVGAVLPVVLSSLEAEEVERGALVKWETSSEENSDRFEIEKLDEKGRVFETIGNVAAAGYSSSNIAYEFLDTDAKSRNINYYRLKQVDFNGEFEYSDVVAVEIEKTEKEEIEIYPNPAVDHISFELNSSENQGLQKIRIYNVQGNLTKEIYLGDNVHNRKVDISDLSSGLYIMMLSLIHISEPTRPY